MGIIDKYHAILRLNYPSAAADLHHLSHLLRSVYYHIPHVPHFIVTWATFFGAGIIFWIYKFRKRLSSFSLRDILHCCVPFDPFTSKSFHTDVKVAVIRKLTDALLIIPEIIAIVAVAAGTCYTLEYVSGQPAVTALAPFVYVICAGTLILAIEFGEYLNHYVNHKIPFLWELHKVHHSAETLNPLTDKRAHPLAVTLKIVIVGPVAGIPAGAFMYNFGINVPMLVIASQASIQMFRMCSLDPLKHSHIPLGYGPLDRILISPHMHQIHHSSQSQHLDTNFGVNLSIFDWMFGTAYKPSKGEFMTFGLHQAGDGGSQKFDTLRDVYIEPVKRSFLILAGSGIRRRRRVQDISEQSPASMAGLPEI